MSDWVVSDAAVNLAVGAELRAAREAAGLTRPELVARLPFKTTVPTLLNWELGHRSVSFARLIELARTLNRSAPELLAAAVARVEAIPTQTVEVDLDGLAAGVDPRFEWLRVWARNRLVSVAEGPVVRVHHTVVREWAVLLGIPVPEVVGHLKETNAMSGGPGV